MVTFRWLRAGAAAGLCLIGSSRPAFAGAISDLVSMADCSERGLKLLSSRKATCEQITAVCRPVWENDPSSAGPLARRCGWKAGQKVRRQGKNRQKGKDVSGLAPGSMISKPSSPSSSGEMTPPPPETAGKTSGAAEPASQSATGSPPPRGSGCPPCPPERPKKPESCAPELKPTREGACPPYRPDGVKGTQVSQYVQRCSQMLDGCVEAEKISEKVREKELGAPAMLDRRCAEVYDEENGSAERCRSYMRFLDENCGLGQVAAFQNRQRCWGYERERLCFELNNCGENGDE